MKHGKWIVGLVAIVSGAVVWQQSQAEPAGGVRKFMRPKLEHAQRVLEGLTLEDHALVAKNAEALLRLSEAAEWQVLPSPEYVRYSEDFQRLAQELVRSANQKNVDAATLAYVQLTMNCVNCHKHVREARRTATP
ncbi:hypothetical protein K2X85_06745 [bacterium]|jgi:hypothetical protein|nr:hypothetical protein [bacterium]